MIALPLLARLYVRKKDLPGIDPKHRPEFRTKLGLAIELLRWAKKWLGLLKKPIWVVTDGAYAKANFLKPAKELGMTVVSRLRKDSALWTVPGPKPAGRRGPAPTYGKDKVSLAKRAGQRRGWSSEVFDLYGKPTRKRYKTFVATLRQAGGTIRVVLVEEPTGWVAVFCTDILASVADILTAVADGFSLEITFRDCKEIVGAGQQQVRPLRANVGAFHVCLWAFTMAEAWAWFRQADELVDRSDSPWDSPLRRPSHADKRRAWVARFWARKSVRLYALGALRRRFRPRLKGCLSWLRSINKVSESKGRAIDGRDHPYSRIHDIQFCQEYVQVDE